MRALADHLPTNNPWPHSARGDEAATPYRRDVDPALPHRVLIADDQWEIREALRLLLKSEGYQIEMVSGPRALLDCLEHNAFDLVLLDLNYTRDTTSGREGLDVLGQIRLIDGHLPVVVMTAWSNVDLAVEAMRSGACDFIQKPWDNLHVLGCVRSHVKRYRAQQRQRRDVERELSDAILTQRRLLPESVPQPGGCEIASAYLPARGVGGDYFDVVEAGAGTALCLADVAGKGIPAAMVMANLQAALKPLLIQGTDPAEVCGWLNHHAASSGKFISFFHAILNVGTGRLSYANAGHVAPIVVHADGSCERLSSGGAVLGYFEEWSYEQKETTLEHGSRLLMFTDGVVEVANGAGQEFGEDRLLQLAVENRYRNAEELKAVLLDAVMAHCDRHLQDDATLLVIAVE